MTPEKAAILAYLRRANEGGPLLGYVGGVADEIERGLHWGSAPDPTDPTHAGAQLDDGAGRFHAHGLGLTELTQQTLTGDELTPVEAGGLNPNPQLARTGGGLGDVTAFELGSAGPSHHPPRFHLA